MPCGTHLERFAAFLCRTCNVYACDDCARHTWVRDHFEDCCPRCGAPMEPTQSDVAAGHDRGASELWSFIRRPSLLMMLVGLTLIVAPLSWAVELNFSPIIKLIGYALIVGLELSIYFRIVVQTAYGSDDISPPGPGFGTDGRALPPVT